MGVGIHKSRQHHASAGVHHLIAAARLHLDLFASAGEYDPPLLHQHGAIGDHREFAHFAAAARALGTCERHQLTAIRDNQCPHLRFHGTADAMLAREPHGVVVPRIGVPDDAHSGV